MKVRQSASLVAGVCTLCVAASGSVTPVASAAAKPLPASSPIVSRPYELTASQGLLVDLTNVAGIPLENFVTIVNALAGAAGGSNGVGGSGATSLQALPNLLYSQLVAGTLTQASATTAINAAVALEQTALTNLAATPQKIINFDITAISNLLGDLGFGSLGTAAAATPFNKNAVTADVAPADTGTAVNLANVLGIPLENFVTVVNALAGAAGGGNGVGGGGATSLQALPNLLYSQLVAGTLTQASATTAINAALATEQTALTNLANTPATIINHDIAAITALFGLNFTSLTASANSITPAAKQTLTTNATSADAGSTAVDFANVVGIPLENFVTALSAVAGAAGGSGGAVNGSGAASLQALPNILYSQLVAGTLTQASATTAINAAVALEKTALTNLANTPAAIINHDVAAITKLVGDFGGASTQATPNVQGSTLALNKSTVTPTVNTPKLLSKTTVKLDTDGPSTDSVSTTPTSHAKKANDNNPVANAIKSITKGSYTGKHRADDAKASATKGDDGSQGDGATSSKESKHSKSK